MGRERDRVGTRVTGVARCVGGESGTVDGGPLVKYLYRYVGLWRPDAGAAGVFK